MKLEFDQIVKLVRTRTVVACVSYGFLPVPTIAVKGLKCEAKTSGIIIYTDSEYSPGVYFSYGQRNPIGEFNGNRLTMEDAQGWKYDIYFRPVNRRRLNINIAKGIKLRFGFPEENTLEVEFKRICYIREQPVEGTERHCLRTSFEGNEITRAVINIKKMADELAINFGPHPTIFVEQPETPPPVHNWLELVEDAAQELGWEVKHPFGPVVETKQDLVFHADRIDF